MVARMSVSDMRGVVRAIPHVASLMRATADRIGWEPGPPRSTSDQCHSALVIITPPPVITAASRIAV
jgi:hypothetical protein